MIRIVICDDKTESLEAIKRSIMDSAKQLNTDVELYAYTDGNCVLELLTSGKDEIDILFLDIDMPRVNGLDVAKKIREMGLDIILIFISAHEEYVFESIDYNPFKYIRKIRLEEEMPVTLKRAFKRIADYIHKYYFLKTEDGEVRLRHEDILYIERFRRKITVKTCDEQIYTMSGRKPLKEVYQELDNRDFVQIHSGCIVNAKYIMRYSNHDITLDTGEKLIVSRSKVATVKETMSRYWRDKI